MTDAQKIESTLTDRYRTTVPEPVRRALKLGKRDKIRYIVREYEVVITRATAREEDDPVAGKFLQFLLETWSVTRGRSGAYPFRS